MEFNYPDMLIKKQYKKFNEFLNGYSSEITDLQTLVTQLNKIESNITEYKLVINQGIDDAINNVNSIINSIKVFSQSIHEYFESNDYFIDHVSRLIPNTKVFPIVFTICRNIDSFDIVKDNEINNNRDEYQINKIKNIIENLLVILELSKYEISDPVEQLPDGATDIEADKFCMDLRATMLFYCDIIEMTVKALNNLSNRIANL